MTNPVSPLPGIKVLLIGGPGSGKTHALRTFIDAGITPYCIFTENSYDVLGDVPPDKLGWVYRMPVKEDMGGLMDVVKKMGVMSFEQMTKMIDPKRGTDNRFYAMLEPMMEFHDERTGLYFGNAGLWGTGRALVFDSLSGLSKAAISLVAGTRPALGPSDYGMAQKPLEALINQLCTALRCHVAVIAHAEQETDPINGGTKITASSVGKALAPVIPRYFTDVIYSKRVGAEFFWDTADPRADLKARNCPISQKLPPSFAPLIAAWKKRGGIIESAEEGHASPQPPPTLTK